MVIKYFEDTDTALLELGDGTPSETQELSEDIYLDFDESGDVISITVEHASIRSDLSEVSFKRINKAKDGSIQPATRHELKISLFTTTLNPVTEWCSQ